MWHSDTFRQRYLVEIARRMQGEDAREIERRAMALLDKWERQDGVDHRYVLGWRRVIAEGAEGVYRIAGATGPDAEAMRHCMPFAGILTNRERAELRRRAR